MKKRTLFLALVTPLFLASQNKSIPYQIGEYCKYKISFGPISAGYGELTVSNIVYKDEVPIYHMVGYGRTTILFDWFFKVRDTYETYIDTNTRKPVFFNRDVYEGGHVIKQKYSFNHKKKQIFTQDSTYIISDSAQDMLSAIFLARGLNKEEVVRDSAFSINIFMDEENYILHVKYLFDETISTKWGKIKCMVFRPKMQKGRVFANEERMKVWISDDTNRLLMKVETEIWAGTIVGKLIEARNLKTPLQVIK